MVLWEAWLFLFWLREENISFLYRAELGAQWNPKMPKLMEAKTAPMMMGVLIRSRDRPDWSMPVISEDEESLVSAQSVPRRRV